MASIPPDEKLKHLFNETFPQCLGGLNKRSEALSQMIQYLESEYTAADSIDYKNRVKDEAKTFLLTALAGTASDLEVVATNVAQVVEIETNATLGLTNDIAHIKERIQISKESHRKLRLSNLEAPMSVEQTTASK